MDDDVTIADVLSFAGADLQDVARMIADLPADLQPSAAVLSWRTSPRLTMRSACGSGMVLAAVAAVIE